VRIAIVTWRDLTHPMAGGSEVLVDELARGMQERGHEVSVICGGPVSPEAARCRPYRLIEAGGTFSQYLLAPYLCERRTPGADVLIDVENGIPYFSPLWHRGPRMCLVNHVHTDQWADRFPRALALVGKLAETKAMPVAYRHDVFVAVSQSTAEALMSLGVDADRIRVIEIGVSPRYWARPGLSAVRRAPGFGPPSKSLTPLFVTVGRLVPHKRVQLLLEVWGRVQPVVGGRFVIVGDGPEAGRLRDLLPPGAELAGRLTDTERDDLMASAWLLVHGAHHEGWGMTIMEAASAGTPALALDAPGVRDAIVDGMTGVLASDAEDMAKHWVELATAPATLSRMADAAMRRASHQSWDRTVEQYLALASELSARRRLLETNSRSTAGRRRLDDSIPRVFSSSSSSGALSSTGTLKRGDAPASTRKRRNGAAVVRTDGFRRSVELFKGFLRQFDDPDAFYSMLASDTVAMVARYARIDGATVLDVGGGAGYFARAFEEAGSRSTFVEVDWGEMHDRGGPLATGVIGDATRMPIVDCSFDVAHSSNVIEHVADPRAMFTEMLRVVRPGGLVFIAFTNWWSPFGGHETSPWHWLGGEFAARRYESRHGHPPKNRYGSSLFPLHISELLGFAREHPEATLLDALPRYYPSSTRPLVRIPVLREVATWNLAIAMRKH